LRASARGQIERVERMRVELKRLVIDGTLDWAEAQFWARPILKRGESVAANELPAKAVKGRPVRSGLVRVKVRVRLTARDTLAQIRDRARDEALRYLDVA
jgi:hypothetical protein